MRNHSFYGPWKHFWKSNFFNGVKGLIQMIIIISNKMLVERVVHLKIMLFVGAKFSELWFHWSKKCGGGGRKNCVALHHTQTCTHFNTHSRDHTQTQSLSFSLAITPTCAMKVYHRGTSSYHDPRPPPPKLLLSSRQMNKHRQGWWMKE